MGPTSSKHVDIRRGGGGGGWWCRVGAGQSWRRPAPIQTWKLFESPERVYDMGLKLMRCHLFLCNASHAILSAFLLEPLKVPICFEIHYSENELKASLHKSYVPTDQQYQCPSLIFKLFGNQHLGVCLLIFG